MVCFVAFAPVGKRFAFVAGNDDPDGTCCSAIRNPPPEYRNKATCKQAEYLADDQEPIPERRGIPMSNTVRPDDQPIGIDPLDFSLGEAVPQQAEAIEEQIDCDEASHDLAQKKLHSNIR